MKKIIIFILVFSFTVLVADSFDNPVSISLGDASMLRTTDYRCLGWNPSLLYKYQQKITVGLGNYNVFLSNNTLSLKYYNSLMGKKMNESDKQEFLDRIPDSGLGFDINLNVSAPLLALTYKNFAFKNIVDVLTTAKFSKKMFEFIIDDIELKDYDFSDNNGEMAFVMEYNFGYGHKTPLNEYIPYDFPPVYTGISMGYILGMNYAKIVDVESTFSNSADGISIDNYVKARTSGIIRDMEEDEVETNPDGTINGHGFRMDLGFTSAITEQLTVGLSFKNMFGVIVWDNACQEHVFTAYGDSLYAYMEDEELEDEITDSDTSYSISKITQNIPFEIHLAAKYQWKMFDLYLDYVQGFDNSVYTSAKPKISLGAEYDILQWLPVRAGFGFGDDRSSHFSLGSGFVFKRFEFNWASRTYFSPLAAFSKGMTLSLGMMLKF